MQFNQEEITMKKIIALLLAVMMVFALCACADSGDTSLIFTTGSETGTYYAVGGDIAQVASRQDGLNVTAIVGKGSQANIESLAAGTAQLGLVQSDVMSYAYAGTNTFSEKVDGFSVVAALYMEQVQIVTMNPDIKTVADLKGKTVSVGEAGSGVYFNALDILAAYDMDLDDIKAEKLSFSDSADNLKDGKIDAAFIVAGAPTTAISDLSVGGQVYLVSLDDEHIEKLIASSPYYSKNVISKDVYGTDEDVTTVAIAAVIIARDDVPEAAVKSLLTAIFDEIDSLSHAKKAEFSLEFASSITDVPYHPGAVSYFADKGIDVA